MRRLNSFVGAVSRLLAWLAGGCTVVVMLVILADVVQRNATGGSVAGAYEAVSVLMVLITFLALGYAARENNHVRMSLFVDMMPRRIALVAHVIAECAVLLIALWFAYASWDGTLLSRRQGEFTQGLVNLRVWPVRAAIAVGFSFLVIEQLLVIWSRLTPSPQRHPEAHEHPELHGTPAAIEPKRGTDE